MRVHEIWLKYAYYDLHVAKLALHDVEPAIPPALVLAQQAAEKALKGYLVYKEQSVDKTHKLILLVHSCCELDKEFEILLPEAAELSPHVTVSRYPDNFYMLPDLTTAQILVDQAEKIVNFVIEKCH